MRMELFSIGPFTIYSYGLMIAVGILVCIAMGMYRAKKRGMSDDAVLTIAIIGVLSGFIGAKLLYVIVEFDQFIEDPMSVMGGEGFVVYGGIIVGVLSAVIYCRQKKLVFLEYFDLLAPSIAVAQGFGRIGCFLAGCCYGRETDSFLGVVFPEHSMAPSGVKLLPTQLFSSAGDFLIMAILLLYSRKTRPKVLRADDRGTVGSLSTSQFISIGIVAVGLILFFSNKLFHREEKAITTPPEE